ncbi:MAG: hypothetical protein EOO73_16105 [Myxococcales bacterium]|nr:MAG: hypothetical protein EOO73_16105 [Myxococcales bacterium]
MRLRRLGLDAFGPFTGLSLDFTRAKGNGLHLVYGPNEAGKSSSLRAIRDLLFGFPQNSPDAHLHPTAALRLSALIERDGQELAFVRRKKRKDSLSTLDDQPLEEARLARFLNGLDAPSFDRLFGLDHERLQQGAEETLSGQGDVGEALFDAGASGRSVHRVRLALVEEADALFKDRGQKPELNRLLAVYTEQKRQARDSVHLPEKYEEQQESVREKRRDAEARRAELAELRAEKEHAVRLRNVLSSVLERDRKSAQRASLGEVPVLRRGVSAERERLGAELLEAERDLRRLSQKLAEEEQKLAVLPEPGPIVTLSPETVRALGTGIGAANAYIADLPKRQGEARTIRDAISAKLPRLGLGLDLDSVISRILPVAQQARLQALGREHQGLSLKLETAERELPDARAKVEGLTRVLEQARAARRLVRDALLAPEVVDRFDGELAQAEEGVETLVRRLDDGARERGDLVSRLEALRGRDGVPSLALLAQARVDRDARFREAQELAADPKRKALELCLPLAALARATAHADALTDRLRSEAKRVADAEALEQQLAKHDRHRERLEEQLQNARSELSSVNARWASALRSLGAVELLPREAARLLQEEREGWRELARTERELAQAQAALSAAEVRQSDAAAAMVRWRTEWQASVAPLGLTEASRPEEALALLNGLSELSAQRDTLADRERRVVGIQREIASFAAQVREQTEIFAPELSPLSPPVAATRLLELYEIATESAKRRASIQGEMARVKRELGEVESRLRDHSTALAELCREAGVPDAATLASLEQRVESARALEQELTQLDARLAEVCEGEAVEALVEEARKSDRSAVTARLAELDDLIELREEEARELVREVTQLELGLRAYEGRSGADAAQELSATMARLGELSSAWARRRVAAAVLERVVERYRQLHQGPVLSRASDLFRRLTLGRFAKLQVGLEETRLECVEAEGGRGLELEELSRGTRFQLFLALKLASLEQYLKTAPPLPLVLDDVLVEWDDERSRVALEVLAEFSDHLQILLFTHHGRDVSAAASLADGRIFTHHLAPRMPSPG